MMHTIENLSDLSGIRKSMEGPFGLVPTMGALHAGHASLVSRARAECEHVGVSIFVNPAQFGPGEDLSRYPRSIPRDLKMLEALGVDIVWIPTLQSMYPNGFQTWITVEELSRPLEGKSRPGHFRGVVTVVAKLLNAFLPDKAYFGQKDAQQAVVIGRMIRDLNFPVEMVVCPTVRESDGLAVSSRNAYLSPSERKAAAVLYRALKAAKAECEGGQENAAALRTIMRSVIQSEPLAREQYVSVADPDNLGEIENVSRNALLSLAVQIGNTRLIDNILVQFTGTRPIRA